MSEDNPAAGAPVETAPSDLGRVTQVMVDHLRETKPWVRLVSVVGFIGTGFILVVALVLPFAGAMSRGFGGVVGGFAMSLVYLLLGCLYFFPSLFLFRYASAIGAMLTARDGKSMELALALQKSFWRLVGIQMVVVLCIYALALIAIALVGIVAALK